jgi:hypothetical protein
MTAMMEVLDVLTVDFQTMKLPIHDGYPHSASTLGAMTTPTSSG